MPQKYLVSGKLLHGEPGPKDAQGNPTSVVREYQHGEEFSTDDAALEKMLRKNGSILLPEEFAASENPALTQELAAQRESLEAENAALKARLAALEAGEFPKSDAATSSENSENSGEE